MPGGYMPPGGGAGGSNAGTPTSTAANEKISLIQTPGSAGSSGQTPNAGMPGMPNSPTAPAPGAQEPAVAQATVSSMPFVIAGIVIVLGVAGVVVAVVVVKLNKA